MSHPDNSSKQILQLQREVARLKSAMCELNILNEIALKASSTLDVEALLNLLVEKSVDSVQASEGALKLLVEAEKDNPFQTLIRKKHQTSILDFSLGIHITGWVLKHNKPLLIINLAEDPRFQPNETEIQQIKSLICAPIFFKAELLGILTLINKTDNTCFSEDDLRLLTIIASQAGQLIYNRRLQADALEKQRMAHELEIARNIQLGLIPREDPRIQSLQIASFIKTADQVGGDYFDYFEIDENRLGVVIADVSGHGPSAALIMTMVKGTLHAIQQRFQSTDRTIAELNAVLSKIAPPEIFVTMMFLVIDTKQMVMHYANAGHNPLIYFNKLRGEAKFLKFYSPALNISPDATFSERKMPLHDQDYLLIYTDGITETFDEKDKMFAEKGLLTIFKKTVGGEPVLMIEQICNALKFFAGNTPQHDDMAMIAMKICAEPHA